MVGNVQHGEVALHERPDEATESEYDEQQLAVGRGASGGHHGCIVTMRADQRQDTLADGKR